MKLSFSMTADIKPAQMAEFVAILSSAEIELRKIDFLEHAAPYDRYQIKGLSADLMKLKNAVAKLKSRAEYFQNISVSNDLERAVQGGVLETRGKLPVGNAEEYEMNAVGALALSQERIAVSENPFAESGIGRSCGMIAVVKRKNSNGRNISSRYADAESDSVLSFSFSGMNGFPLVIEFEILEDLLKTLKSFQRCFSSLRLQHVDDMEDPSIYEQIADNIEIPVISYQNDELPVFVYAAASRILAKHSLKITDSNIGFIGLDSSAIRITRLFSKTGCQRVLGFDSSEKEMLYFERSGGLATTPENIFGNCDLVIILKNCFTEEDMFKVRPNLLVISLLDDAEIDEMITAKRGCREMLSGRWFEPASLFPHLLKFLPENKKMKLEDKDILSLAAYFEREAGKTMRFPGPFSVQAEKIRDLL